MVSWAMLSKEVGWTATAANGQWERQCPANAIARDIVEKALMGGRGAMKQLLEWHRFCIMPLDPLQRDAFRVTMFMIDAALQDVRKILDEGMTPLDEVGLLVWWTKLTDCTCPRHVSE